MEGGKEVWAVFHEYFWRKREEGNASADRGLWGEESKERGGRTSRRGGFCDGT